MKNILLFNTWFFGLIFSFISVLSTDTKKNAYYLTSTVDFEIQSYPVPSLKESNSEIQSLLFWEISKAALDFDVSINGLIYNIKNESRSGDLACTLFAPKDTLYDIQVVMYTISASLKGINFTKVNAYYLYHGVNDMIMNSFTYQPDFSNPSGLKYNNLQNYLKLNLSDILNGLGLILFEVPIQTFNRYTIKLFNESGRLRVIMKFHFYSKNNILSSNDNHSFIPDIPGNNDSIVYQKYWNKLSTFSTKGFLKYEFYITGTIIIDLKTFLEFNDIIDISSSVFRNISNSLMDYGVLFSGEILHIRNGTLTVDFHGSLLSEKWELLEINDIVSVGIQSHSDIIINNLKTFNMYAATVYAFLDRSVYNYTNLSDNYRQLKKLIKNKLLTGLLKEELLLMDKYYYNFRIEFTKNNDDIGLFCSFLIHSKIQNLFEIQTKVLNVFKLLPSSIDPFNTHVSRNERFTTEHYTNINISFPFYNHSRQFSSILEPKTTNPGMITKITNSLSLEDKIESEISSSRSSMSISKSSIQETIRSSTNQVISTKISLPTTVFIEKPRVIELDINLKFSYSELYIDAYNDTNSEEYKNFTQTIINDLINSFSKNTILKLVSVKINSLKPGSVLADIDMITQSNVPISSSDMKDTVIEIAKSSNQNYNFTIVSAEVTKIKFITTTDKATPSTENKLEDWKIALIVVFSLIGIGILIFIIVCCLKHRPKRDLLIETY